MNILEILQRAELVSRVIKAAKSEISSNRPLVAAVMLAQAAEDAQTLSDHLVSQDAGAAEGPWTHVQAAARASSSRTQGTSERTPTDPREE